MGLSWFVEKKRIILGWGGDFQLRRNRERERERASERERERERESLGERERERGGGVGGVILFGKELTFKALVFSFNHFVKYHVRLGAFEECQLTPTFIYPKYCCFFFLFSRRTKPLVSGGMTVVFSFPGSLDVL